jgi:hypothetical protein
LFNLFVTAKTDAWNQGAYQFGHDRVIQGYSDKSSTARFVDLEDRSVKAELASFPCLLVYEEGMDETVTIGWLTKISPFALNSRSRMIYRRSRAATSSR